MKQWKRRLCTLFLTAIIGLTLTACEDYSEWEARQEAEKENQNQSQTSSAASSYTGPSAADYVNEGLKETYDNVSENDRESPYTGPSLADYVNEGLEEAKRKGDYTETDYSGITTGSDGTQSTDTGNSSGNDTSDSPSSGSSSNNSTETGSGSGNKTSHGSGAMGGGYRTAYGTDEWTGLLNYLAGLEYDGEAYIYVNNNIPFFTESETALTDAFEYYSDLDDLGRTQHAFASIDESLAPPDSDERGDISSVKPTGWVQAKYDSIGNGGWLYNRCHLIAWALTDEDANEKNLMTGTRYFNIEGMLTFETKAMGYVDDNPENHLLYRATPVYDGDDLLAKGLLLEAYSIEDDGALTFCVYMFNAQPDIEIDYATGKSKLEE